MIQLEALRHKASYVLTSRYLKESQIIEEHMAIPANAEEEQQIVRDTVFNAIKASFIGCRINPNKSAFSVRLNGEITTKAHELYKYIQEHGHWKTFLENTHYSKLRTILNLNNVYQERREIKYKEEEDGRRFLYVPFMIKDIPSYHSYGLFSTLDYLKQSFAKEKAVADIADEVLNIIEVERQRRIKAREELMASLETRYREALQRQLLPSIRGMRRTPNNEKHDLIVKKMTEWAAENNVEAKLPRELTYQNVIPVGTEVSLVVKEGSQEEGWFAVPRSGGFEIPEGFKRLSVYDNITRHDTEHKRSRDGAAPLVLNEDTFTEFDIQYWQHLIPEEYAMYKEAYDRFVAETTDEEVAQVLAEKQRLREEEMQRKAAEAEAQAAIAEAEAEAEKKQSLADLAKRIQESAGERLVEDNDDDDIELDTDEDVEIIEEDDDYEDDYEHDEPADEPADYLFFYNGFSRDKRFVLRHASGEEEYFASQDDLRTRAIEELELEAAIVRFLHNPSRVWTTLN